MKLFSWFTTKRERPPVNLGHDLSKMKFKKTDTHGLSNYNSMWPTAQARRSPTLNKDKNQ